ncbi:uncharacterized protein LOC113561421 [Ooceraea biroi]|uniref:uncharacterized protein LOC113561421 n=1 Tax=Ooceraea biroi TaxID=2015173 RepID=UPI000F074004|nr:uncharacterized protein LOC113561421 [Ooceraea biroi]
MYHYLCFILIAINKVTSIVCSTVQIHFGEDQWEQKRVDGSRKLRCLAIPSLLSSEENSSPTPYIDNRDVQEDCRTYSALAIISHPATFVPQSRSPLKDISNINVSTAIPPATSVTSVNLSEKIATPKRQTSPIIDVTEDESVEVLKQRLKVKEKEVAALQIKQISMQKLTNRILRSYCNMKKRHKTIQIKLKRLQEAHRNRRLALRLHEDQFKALCSKSTRGKKWSTSSIIDELIYKMK